MWILTFLFLLLLEFRASSAWSVTCPVECSCDIRTVFLRLVNQSISMKTVDCSNRRLKRIPRDLPADAEAIFLQNNSITMHVGIKQLPQLRVLDLSHNIVQGFFGRLSLPQLEHLDIAYNLIPRVSSSDNDFFALLRNLRTLSLRGNGIQVVDENTLDLPRLTSLDLAENSLVTIKSATFENLRLMKNLDLSHNNISNIALSTALNLESLNLSFNRIKSVGGVSLKVESLDLTNASFSILSRDSVRVSGVKRLTLRNSLNLWKISSTAFINQNALERLDFSDCQTLIYIEPETFNNLSINEIMLDNSSLIQLPEELTKYSLSLTNVPLSCQLNAPLILNSAHLCRLNQTERWLNGSELRKVMETSGWNSTQPIIIPSFPPVITADLGSVLEIQCLTAGEVAGTSWIRLDERRKREYPMPSFSGVLRVGPLYRVDSGKYVCRVYNEFGSVNRSVQVNVTYAPVIIIPIVISHQYVTFAWNNSDPSIASQFRVIYFEEENGNFTQIRTIFMDHLVRTYTIGNLKSGTTYRFCLFLNKSGIIDELDCKNMTTKIVENTGRSFESAYELLIVIGCISSLLFFIFISTCIYRFYQEKQQDSMSESLSRILLSDTSAINSEATTPVTYFNPAVDPLTPTTDLDVRAAFLPENHPYRNVTGGYGRRCEGVQTSEC